MPPFSDAVMELFHNPRNVGTLEPPRGEGLAGSVQRGVFMRIHVRAEGGLVQAARFSTYGCVPAIAAGSWVASWAEGRAVDDAGSLEPKAVVEALGGLPPERLFCAQLAVDALRAALAAASSEAEEKTS